MIRVEVIKVVQQLEAAGIGNGLRFGLRLWRSVAGPDTILERSIKQRLHGVRRALNPAEDSNVRMFQCGKRSRRRVGIYLKGSCDLVAMFHCQPFIREALDGRCCIFRHGSVSDSRSDLLLQSLQKHPPEQLEPVRQALRLPDDYFRPVLFEKDFRVPSTSERFQKDLVVISIAADVTRTLYRHREHGLLVDPGGWWLNQSMETVLADLSAATWFKDKFVSIGQINVEAFYENFSRIVALVMQRTGAPVLVFNVLCVDPGSPTHNYQFVRNPATRRRREFNLALTELSRKLDFSIVDVDRILKRAGVKTQVDFAHFPSTRFQPIASEAFCIMRDLGVL